MIELLDEISSIDRGGRVHINLSFYSKKQVDQVENAIKYYRTTPVYIKPDHVLMQLADMTIYEDGNNPYAAFRYMSDAEKEICVALGITTSTFKGRINHRDFPFNKGCAIASVQKYTLANLLKGKWSDLKPVQLVYRPSSDYTLELPTSEATKVDTFGALAIDLPAFAYMCASWRAENYKKPLEQQEKVSEFVSKFILAPLIKDSARLGVLNLMKDGKVSSEKSNTPFVTIDQMDNIKKELEELKTSFLQQSIHHSNIMAELPCLDTEDIYSVIPDIEMDYLTENNRWFKMLVESQIVNPILYMTRNEKDKDVLLRFRVFTRMLNSNGVLRKSPSDEMNKELKSIYELTESLIVNR